MKPTPDWKSEFRYNRPDWTWMPKSALKEEQESPIKYFGYKWYDGKSLHEVTDWGNIEKFIEKTIEAEKRKAVAELKESLINSYEGENIKSFIKSELLSLRERIEGIDLATGIGAVPETNEYAKGWNDCRKLAFEARKDMRDAVLRIIDETI